MQLKQRLRDEHGYMNLGSAILGVVLIMIVILTFGGLSHQVLRASETTSTNTARTTIAESQIALLALRSATIPTATGNSITVDPAIGQGWTWSEDIPDGGRTLKLAIPKLGHVVADCQAIASSGVDDGDCVIARSIIRDDVEGIKVQNLAHTINAARTVMTVTVPAGAPSVRYYIPYESAGATSTRIDFTSTPASGPVKTGTTGQVPLNGTSTADAYGEVVTDGVAQTLVFTISGGVAEHPEQVMFYRGAF